MTLMKTAQSSSPGNEWDSTSTGNVSEAPGGKNPHNLAPENSSGETYTASEIQIIKTDTDEGYAAVRMLKTLGVPLQVRVRSHYPWGTAMPHVNSTERDIEYRKHPCPK